MGQEELELLKQEVRDSVHLDLSKGTYKMTQAKIVALIGCTITVCLTIFGAVLYFDRTLTKHDIKIEQHTIDINSLKTGQAQLWTEANFLQGQINNIAQQK